MCLTVKFCDREISKLWNCKGVKFWNCDCENSFFFRKVGVMIVKIPNITTQFSESRTSQFEVFEIRKNGLAFFVIHIDSHKKTSFFKRFWGFKRSEQFTNSGLWVTISQFFNAFSQLCIEAMASTKRSEVELKMEPFSSFKSKFECYNCVIFNFWWTYTSISHLALLWT